MDMDNRGGMDCGSRGGEDRRRAKGENWDNCNRINKNKIKFKKKKDGWFIYILIVAFTSPFPNKWQATGIHNS